MAPPNITPEQIEVLRKEFAKLQDQLKSLEFPKSASEGIQKFNDALKESYLSVDKQQRAIEELNKQYIKQQDELMRVASSHGTASDEYARAESLYNETTAARTAANVNLAESHVQLGARLSENADQLAKAGDAQRLYTEALRDLETAQNGATEAIRAAAYDEYIRKIREASEAVEELAEDVKFGEDTFDGLAQSMFGLSGPFKTFADMATKGEGGLQGFTTQAMESVKSGELLANALFKLVQVSFEFALEQDKVIADFRKSTGAGKEFNDVIRDVERNGRIAGVTLEEASEAMGALKNTFTDFTYYSKDTQEEIANTVTILGEMGFSFQTQASIMQTATQSMGMSLEGAQTLLLDLQGTAKSLGIDVNDLGQEFEANKNILSLYGTRAGDVFKEMAVQAKAVGVEVGAMLGLMEGFDTFEGAAQKVGRLNAILGGPFLNAIDMLNASYEDPAEGIRMLRDAMDEAGVAAENLSGAELKAMSDALGMSVSDTAAMLSKSNEELAIEAMTMEKAAKEAKNMQAITEQLSNAFKQLYLNTEPLLTNVLIPLVGKFAEFMAWVGGGIGKLNDFGSTALFVATAMAAILMMIPGMQVFSLAGLAIIGGAALGVGGAVSAMGPGEEPGPSTADLSYFGRGGRVLRSHQPKRMQSFAGGGVVQAIASAMGLTPEAVESELSADASGAMAGSPLVPIRMNEGNQKELAIVPSGTLVANAGDTKNVIQTNQAMIAEIRGLRRDLAAASKNGGTKKVQLVLDNGREFSTTVVREGLSGDVVTPFGVG